MIFYKKRKKVVYSGKKDTPLSGDIRGLGKRDRYVGRAHTDNILIFFAGLIGETIWRLGKTSDFE